MFDADVPLADQEPVDYTEAYNRSYGADVKCVHAVGREMLVLSSLTRPRHLTVVKSGRKREVLVSHVLESSTLSIEAREGEDDYAAVEYGPDIEYLTVKQALPLLRAAANGESLFKHAQLF